MLQLASLGEVAPSSESMEWLLVLRGMVVLCSFKGEAERGLRRPITGSEYCLSFLSLSASTSFQWSDSVDTTEALLLLASDWRGVLRSSEIIRVTWVSVGEEKGEGTRTGTGGGGGRGGGSPLDLLVLMQRSFSMSFNTEMVHSRACWCFLSHMMTGSWSVICRYLCLTTPYRASTSLSPAMRSFSISSSWPRLSLLLEGCRAVRTHWLKCSLSWICIWLRHWEWVRSNDMAAISGRSTFFSMPCSRMSSRLTFSFFVSSPSLSSATW